MSAFWDASAVLPLVVPVQRSKPGRELLRAQAPVVWWGTPVEAQSGLARLKQERALTQGAYESSTRKLAALLAAWHQIQPDENVRALALEQWRRFALGAGDALQLGAALEWAKQKPLGRIFVANDRRLSQAARAMGFVVESV